MPWSLRVFGILSIKNKGDGSVLKNRTVPLILKMIYPEAIAYLNSFANYEKNTNYSYRQTLKIARIQNFLSVLGNPQKNLRVIHIAGTKGKGSTCAFVAYILREAGYSVGLYTSPHLNDFRERIRILTLKRHPEAHSLRSVQAPPKDQGVRFFAPEPALSESEGELRMTVDFEGRISKQDLSCLVKELKPAINKYNHQSKYGPLSFFEVYTAMAFLYFKQKKTDFVVLETGLGGRLDATNTADSLVCGITPISLEHVQKLGKTLAKISAEKSGIIKKFGAIVISAAQNKNARQVISNRCKKFKADFLQVGRQIKYFKDKFGFKIKGLFNTYKNLRIKLIGQHQMANASLAVGIIEALNFYGFNISAQAIRRGLGSTIWPGRVEVIGKDPLVVLDGAQNLASAQVLKNTIRENFKYQKLILVLGISGDKNLAGICKTLEPLADEIILTAAATHRATDPRKLATYFKRKLYLTKSVKEAKLLAKKLAEKKDLILVTGSLFVVGEFRKC